MSERLTDAELDAWAVRHKNAAEFFDFPYDEDYGMLRLLDQGKEANALAAEVERLKAENAEIDGCARIVSKALKNAVDATHTLKKKHTDLEREAAGLRAKAALADEIAAAYQQAASLWQWQTDWLARYTALRGAR